jgi:hypothetical protein
MIKNKKNSSSIVFFFVLLEIRKNLARAGFNSSFFIARAFCSSERGSSYLQGSGSSNHTNKNAIECYIKALILFFNNK